MKKILSIISFTLILLSCSRDDQVSVGFDSAVDPGGYGMTRLTMENSAGKIYLEGNVRTDSGSIIVTLFYPSGSTAWITTLSGTNEVLVDQEFNNESGDWALKYESQDGAGYIKLSLHN